MQRSICEITPYDIYGETQPLVACLFSVPQAPFALISFFFFFFFPRRHPLITIYSFRTTLNLYYFLLCPFFRFLFFRQK